ncbi:MAG: PEP-CTERM sorting domain-containing protein [Akkermansiaceae bacterium]
MNHLARPFLCLTLLTLSPSHGGVVISEIDLDNNKIELINTGGASVDLNSHWLCNRVNGSPFYSQITSYTIDVGNSTAASFNVGAGEILVLNLTAGLLPHSNGEMGLYNTNSFTSTAAIDDYILWGANGIRDIVAEGAGIWTDNNSIDVSGRSLGETLQLNPAEPGNSASDYFIAPSSFGSVNIPEPSSLLFVCLGAWGFASRRRR